MKKDWKVQFYNTQYKVINDFILNDMTEQQAEQEAVRQIQLFREHVEDYTIEEVKVGSTL